MDQCSGSKYICRYLDPDPEVCPHLDPHPGPNLDSDPEMLPQFWSGSRLHSAEYGSNLDPDQTQHCNDPVPTCLSLGPTIPGIFLYSANSCEFAANVYFTKFTELCYCTQRGRAVKQFLRWKFCKHGTGPVWDLNTMNSPIQISDAFYQSRNDSKS